MDNKTLNLAIVILGVVAVGAILYKWYKDQWWSPGVESLDTNVSDKQYIDAER